MLYTVVYMEYCRDDTGREPVKKRYPLETKGESIQMQREKIDKGRVFKGRESKLTGGFIQYRKRMIAGGLT